MSGPDGASAAVDPVSIADYAVAAKAALPMAVWDYVAGGAGEETTVAANLEAFRRTALRPRCLVDVSRRRPCRSVLGSSLAAPIGVAPVSYHRLVHPDGEVATAKAAGDEGLLMVVSTFASQPLEAIASSTSGPLWFQLYCFRDRSLTEALARRAEAAGYQALVLTVDMPLMGRRHRDVRNGFCLPAGVAAMNLSTGSVDGRPDPSLLAERNDELVDPTLSWADLGWLRSLTRLPIVLKGIMAVQDAVRAAEEGVAGLVVSNHGGRQVDGALASLDALAEVASAVGGRCEVLMDGGVRSGTDVLKALALGARAVLVGRPVLWGLAAGGEAGVRRVLRLYRQELDLAMACCGCPELDDITPDLVARSPAGGL